jgi:predicted nucleotidyltransferase
MIAAGDRQTALEFKRYAAALVPIRQFCAFGSRARRDATAGSDLDVFLVVDHIDCSLREKI